MKDLQTEPQKRVLCVGVVGQMLSAWYIRSSKHYQSLLETVEKKFSWVLISKGLFLKN